MATATSVLAVGAIPVIVDIDESITIDPAGRRGRRSARAPRAVVPVHMWGAACDMDAIMDDRRSAATCIVIEDACQGVGGGYEGRKFGTIGHVGGFSFNYYKNMTCGEGGGVAINDDAVAERARCAIDPCHFYWHGRSDDVKPFAGNGARASELMGAMLNVQLDRLDGMIGAMRAEKKRDPRRHRVARQSRPQAAPMNSPDHDCATQVMFTLPTRRGGRALRQDLPERHRRQDRPAQLHRMGPGADGRRRRPPGDEPLQLCRPTPSAGAPIPRTCAPRSLEILNRTVMVRDQPAAHRRGHRRHHPQHRRRRPRRARRRAARGRPSCATSTPVDAQKFDIAGREGAA